MSQPPRQSVSGCAFSCYLRDVSRHPLLSADEERALSLALQTGCPEARQRLIQCNLRLVIHTARQYQRQSMAIDDLVEEGNLGLMHALEKFDPQRGYRFSTYAIWWIRQYIERAIMNQSRTVRLPVHMAKRLNTLIRTRRQLSQKSYREPSLEDLACCSGRSLNEVRELLPWTEANTSLDSVGSADGCGWDICDPKADNPENTTAVLDLNHALQRLLQRLTPREQRVLCLRFGFPDGDPLTYEAIADAVGLTRERVRQINLEALFRLKTWMQDERLDAGCVAED